MPKILIKSGAGAPTTTDVVDSEIAFNRTKGAIYVGLGTASGGAASSVVEMARADHAHGNLTNAGKIGNNTAAGAIVKTIASGDLGTLGLGTAGQVLKVNSGATDIEWGALASADLPTIDGGTY